MRRKYEKIYIGYRSFAKTIRGRYLVDNAKLKVPIFGELMKKVQLAFFARTLSMLISAGIPILEALDISRETVSNIHLKEGVANAAGDRHPQKDHQQAAGGGYTQGEGHGDPGLQGHRSVTCHGKARSLSAGHHHATAGLRPPRDSPTWLLEHPPIRRCCCPPRLHSTPPQAAAQSLGIGDFTTRQFFLSYLTLPCLKSVL